MLPFHAAYSILIALKGVCDEKNCRFIAAGVGAGGVWNGIVNISAVPKYPKCI